MSFLGGAPGKTSNYFLMSFDREKGWCLDAGSVHGIVKGSSGDSTLLAVCSDDTDDLENLDNSLGEVQTTEVNAANSIIKHNSKQIEKNFDLETLKRSFEHGKLEGSSEVTKLQQEVSKTTEPSTQKASNPTGLFGPDTTFSAPSLDNNGPENS